MAVVMIADLTIITDVAGQIGLDQFPDITAASAYDLDPLRFKHILGTLPHVSGKHHGHTHLPEYWSDSALASAALRRGKLANSTYLSVDYIKYRIICTMAEMVIYTSIPCRYCYLHIQIFKRQET